MLPKISLHPILQAEEVFGINQLAILYIYKAFTVC